MTDGEPAPDPREARDPAAFVARLQALKDWSGLTYRELSSRAEAAGDSLPRSTVANMLSRTTVPREELVMAFVRACGAAPGKLENWLAVRKELAVRGGHGGADGGADRGTPGDASPPPEASRWRVLVPVAAVVTLVLAALTVVAFLRGDEARHVPGARAATPAAAPEAGPVDVRAVHSGLCLNERPGQRSGQVYQVPCAGAVVPRYSLVPLDGGLWRLRSDHPDYGPGCAGLPVEAGPPEGAPLVDQECGRRGAREAFRIESAGGEGYRIRSAHSGLCLGVPDASAAPWTEVVQGACDEGGRGQLFSFDRRRAR